MTRLLATRTQVVLLLLVLVVGVAVLGGIGWVTWSARAAAAVSVSWHPDCPDSTQVDQRSGEPVIRSRAGWRCDMEVQVTNTGDRSVRVSAVDVRMLGPESQLEARALSPDARPRDSGTGARLPVDLVVPAGGRGTVSLPMGWREEGCNGAGSATIRPFLTVEVEALRRTATVTAPESLVLRTFDDRHDEVACPT